MLHKALEGAVMLHTFPKTTVDVFALVLESGGSMILYLPLLLVTNNTLEFAFCVEANFFQQSITFVELLLMPK
jgi:hypothetical protein